MFSLAYVILPFADTAPADAIRASLAPFQRAGRGEMPDEHLAFDDETASLRAAHEASFTFTDTGRHGLQVEGGVDAHWLLDSKKVLPAAAAEHGFRFQFPELEPALLNILP